MFPLLVFYLTNIRPFLSRQRNCKFCYCAIHVRRNVMLCCGAQSIYHNSLSRLRYKTLIYTT